MTYYSPEEIAVHLYKRKPFWFRGKPTISLSGKKGEFGTLCFDFHDELVTFKIRIEDPENILDAAYLAVRNFSLYIDKYLEGKV